MFAVEEVEEVGKQAASGGRRGRHPEQSENEQSSDFRYDGRSCKMHLVLLEQSTVKKSKITRHSASCLVSPRRALSIHICFVRARRSEANVVLVHCRCRTYRVDGSLIRV